MTKGMDRFTRKLGLTIKKEINLGLGRMLEVLDLIGNPQRDLKAVHIAGTNGKGSTLQFLRNIVREAGYSVGTFTSPYILNVNDQISTNSGAITDQQLEETLLYLYTIAGEKIEELTEFELLTVLAIVYFSRISKQDMIIFETGMGGLTDSTNVINPILTIITTISLEHTGFLGDTIEKISYQKAGIIKGGIPCITGVKNPEALNVIKSYAAMKKARVYAVNEDFSVTHDGHQLSVETAENQYNHLRIGLKGPHQKENGSLAIKAAELLQQNDYLNITKNHIEKGIKNTFFPGRFEVISENPLIILDGAHNPDAIYQLIETIKEEYPNRRYHFIFGALKDKNTKLMIEMIEQIAHKITFIHFNFARAASAERLASQSTLDNIEIWTELGHGFVNELRSQQDEIIIITGSLYLLSEIKSNLGRNSL
ncbi:folylpolyglutamate synthase/dihydrofolate synthase family protein [Neobacillus niacini]|uniref:bifunctional folylpolyglutamate synthase/dihydrofolate synthase n=1 Tax=Neobacillus niacini TaxID=86668 RepID=UPI003000038A